MATLSFKSINKIYPNHVQAVFDFNLDVKDKEFIVFVGPSGCGKSTTLRMIAGLEEITYGQLYINGLEVNNVEPKDRNIAMVFQSYALYPHMTVFNNMAFSLKLRKVKMPVYEQNEEVIALRQQNEELFKEVAKINRVIRKKNEPKEALEERERILDKIYENEAKALSLSKQLTGISNLEIEAAQNAIKKIQKDIDYSKATLVKCDKDIQNVTAKLESEELPENKREFYEKTLKSLEDIKRLTSEGLSQKEMQLEESIKQKEFYENNEVLLFESRKHTKYEIALEVYKTARILDLSRYLFRKPAALSGGQRQRVALGRAIVRNPQVFLMDEPLSNLDAKLRVQMRSEIIKIHEAVGATTIYVTHDQTEAMTMASRIVVMKDGYIQQIGTPKEVYNDPENLFVAGFIGSPSMNFFKGVVKGDKFYFDGEKEVPLSLGKEHAFLLKEYDGKAVTLGVRPESIFLKGNVNNNNPSDVYKTVCDFSELLGHELVIYTDINGQKLVFKTSTKDEVVSHDNIEICFNNDCLYFFDSETTKRIR